MPAKKSFLSNTSKFYKPRDSNNSLEKDLKKLMNQANDNYNKIYRKSKNNPDTEKFNTCREDFNQIKSIIELKANSTPLINKLHLEAWISTLYSDVHALNLQVETETQLKELIGKIQAIEADFEKLSAENKKTDLNLNIEGAVDLVKYIQNFKNTWKINKIRLLADIYFNFGLTLLENSNLEKALIYFRQSKNAYNEAAKIAANSASVGELSKEKLVKAADQTQEKIQSLLNKNPEVSLKELRIHLQRIPDSGSKWTIINESSPAQTIKEKRAIEEVKSFNEKTDPSSKVKRKSNEEPTYSETKKPKIDLAIVTHPKKFQWKKECEELLNEFKLMGINYNRSNTNIDQKSPYRIKADICFKSALSKTENLMYLQKNVSNDKKLQYLKEIERYFSKSIYFYKEAGLIHKKGKIIHCQDTLVSTINEFKTSIYMGKFPIKPKVISRKSEISLFFPKNVDLGTSKSKDFSPMNTEKYQTKAVISLPKEKFLQYQHTYSTRYVQNFFRDYSLEQNLTNHQNQKIVCP